MHSTLCIAQVYNGRKCTFFSSADLEEWWCRHPTKCPSLHFPILGTDSHVKHWQKVREGNLEETTPMSKIPDWHRQIAPNSKPSGDGSYVGVYLQLRCKQFARRARKKCAQVQSQKLGQKCAPKKCAHCKDLAFDFCRLPLPLAQTWEVTIGEQGASCMNWERRKDKQVAKKFNEERFWLNLTFTKKDVDCLLLTFLVGDWSAVACLDGAC